MTMGKTAVGVSFKYTNFSWGIRKGAGYIHLPQSTAPGYSRQQWPEHQQRTYQSPIFPTSEITKSNSFRNLVFLEFRVVCAGPPPVKLQNPRVLETWVFCNLERSVKKKVTPPEEDFKTLAKDQRISNAQRKGQLLRMIQNLQHFWIFLRNSSKRTGLGVGLTFSTEKAQAWRLEQYDVLRADVLLGFYFWIGHSAVILISGFIFQVTGKVVQICSSI